MRLRALLLSEAADILAAIGCGDDPFEQNGNDTTVHDIYMRRPNDVPARQVRGYYYHGRKGRTRGTVQAMVADRLSAGRWNQ